MAISKLGQPFSEEWDFVQKSPAFGPVEPPKATVSEILFNMMDHRNIRVNQEPNHHFLTAEPETFVKAHNDAVKQGASIFKLKSIKDTYDAIQHSKPAATKRLSNGTFLNVIY